MAFTILTLLAAGIAFGLLAASAWLWWHRQRWRSRVQRARRRAAPRYPVILLHGLFGFDELEIGGRSHEYFRGVRDRLQGAGTPVHLGRVQRVARVSVRAQQLALRIRELPDKRVNIIAHSMGGLDARFAAAKLGIAERVASITTIATPHRGSPLADLGTGIGGHLGISRLLAAAGVDVNAFTDLTTQSADRFNREVEDADDVYYACVVGRSTLRETNRLLRPTHRILSARAGANDGLVPVSSQIWGEVLAQVEADHWAQTGWSRRFDAADFFEELMRELRGRGL